MAIFMRLKRTQICTFRHNTLFFSSFDCFLKLPCDIFSSNIMKGNEKDHNLAVYHLYYLTNNYCYAHNATSATILLTSFIKNQFGTMIFDGRCLLCLRLKFSHSLIRGPPYLTPSIVYEVLRRTYLCVKHKNTTFRLTEH